MSDYMLSVLMIEPTKVFVFFSFTCITAPTLGVILGGVIIHRQGGYATPNAMNICVVVMGLANTVSIPAAFVENFNVYARSAVHRASELYGVRNCVGVWYPCSHAEHSEPDAEHGLRPRTNIYELSKGYDGAMVQGLDRDGRVLVVY